MNVQLFFLWTIIETKKTNSNETDNVKSTRLSEIWLGNCAG